MDAGVMETVLYYWNVGTFKFWKTYIWTFKPYGH